MKVSDVMTKDVMTCKVDDKLSVCADMMRQLNVGFMPVVDSSQSLVGVITDRDIAIRAVAQNVDLANARVGEFITQDPVAIGPNISVEDAADIMAECQIRRLAVLDKGKLIGVVALGDLAVDVGEAELLAETVERISEPVR